MSQSTVPYEATQDFNPVTRFLHSFRHRLASDFVGEVAKASPGRPVRVLEIGCAAGRTFAIINAEHEIQYLGIDASPEFIAAAKSRFSASGNAAFVCASAADTSLYAPDSADIVFALETLEHIPERDVVRIVETVCQVVRPRLFIVSVPIEIGPSIWIKNIGVRLMGYRRTAYTPSQTFWAGLYKLNRLPPHGTGHVGFNWFWLEQTIRHNARIRESRSLPYRWLPKILAPTVMFVAEPARPKR